MADKGIENRIKFGESSRLIPVVADMSKEERAISPVLAVFSMVPTFANSMLEEVGGPTNRRARINCYSQVVFDGPSDAKRLRPDGLIVVDSGRKVWSALVEAKIGNAELATGQIDEYLELAKSLGIDAVITVSNQFAAVPTHHPVEVDRRRLRAVALYHFSWLSLLTKATLLAESKNVDDPEQAFLLRELIRYLSHSSSGVCEFTRMGKEWKEVCTRVQTGTPIAKGDSQANFVVSDWHQLARFLALDLSTAVGDVVSEWLPREHQKDLLARRNADCQTLVSESVLRLELQVPNAANRTVVEADFLRRSLRFSIRLETPQDKSRPTAAISWVIRQLPNMLEATDTLVRVHWPGRAADTVATISDVCRDSKSVVPADKKELPSFVEIQRVVDVAGRFKGSSTFVEDIRRELPKFYKDVVQNVSNWVPKPPKMSTSAPASEDRSCSTQLGESSKLLSEGCDEQ